MATSGGLGCPESDTRQDYYDMGGLPHIVWDGVVHQTGSGSDDNDGVNFQAIINDRLAEESPLTVSVVSYRFFGADPYLTVQIEVFEELPSTAGTYLRVGICENGLSYGGQNYHNILRDMPPDTPLTIQHVGEIQEVTMPLNISGDWDLAELWAFVFVQRDTDKLIYNAGSTYVTPYSVYVETDGGQSAIVAGPHTFGTTEITHNGMAPSHTLDISLDTSSLPAGWDAYFTLDGQDLTFATVTLAQYETADLNVTVVPGDEGYHGIALLNLHSHGEDMPDVVVPFTGILLGADLLIVAGDSAGGYADEFFGPAVETAGYSYSVWDRSYTTIDAATMQNYDTVIWYSGDYGPGLYEIDRSAIETYLDSGGNMLFSGQDLASQTVSAGGSSWLISVLRTFYRTNDDGGPLVAGIDGDPVSDGLSLDLQGGDGAGNFFDPDVVTAFGSTEQSVSIFTYTDTDKSAGTRVDYDGYKHIFLGFGFESINSAADREALMESCLDWLIDSTTPVVGGLPQVAALHRNVPNPFNPMTTIRFSLAREQQVKISVFDLTGKRMAELVNGVRPAGDHTVQWNGKDASGHDVSSGTYLIYMESEDRVYSSKMMLVR